MSPINRRLRRFGRVKFLILLLGVQLLCLLLWGLTWPQPSVELSFVVPQNEVSPWQTVIDAFEQEHPNIRVTLITDPDDYTTDQRKAIYTSDFQIAALRGKVIQHDLVYMDIVWALEFAAAGNLEDLTPYVDRDQDEMDLAGFLPSELDVGKLDGRIYRIPMRSDVGLLFYRQDLLQQKRLELPKNKAELSAVVKQLAPGNGYLWQGSPYEGLVANFVEVLGSLGGTWIDPNTGQVTLDAPLTIEAAKQLAELLEKDLSPRDVLNYIEQDSLEQFKSGQAVFLRGWPQFWTELQKSNLAGKVAIAPPFSFGDNPGVGCRGGWGFGIPKKSRYPEEAWEAIKYFTSESAQRQFVLASGYLPTRNALFNESEIKAQYPDIPDIPDMLDYLENRSIFRPQIKSYGEASDILQSALSQILRGQQDADVAMAEAQQKTEELLFPQSKGG